MIGKLFEGEIFICEWDQQITFKFFRKIIPNL